jgi:transcriptional regulator with XRE-family HTH domain
MSDVGAVLKNLRKTRGLTLDELEQATADAGHKVSKSQIGKVERGERSLSDEVYSALSRALHLGDDERARVEAARAGEVVDIAEQLTLVEQRLLLELTMLRGELRGHSDAIMAAIERLRPRTGP